MQCDIQKNVKSIIVVDIKSAGEYIKLLEYFKKKGFFDIKEGYSFLKFKFCLPYLFHIDEGTYEIRIDNEEGKCSFKKKHTTKVEIKEGEKPSLTTQSNSPEIDKLINAELIRDSSGKFWFTEFEMEIPFTKKEIEFYENKKEVSNDSVRTCLIVNKLLNFINRFITCYRNTIFEPQIKEVKPQDIRLIFLDQGDSYFAITFFEQLPIIDYVNSPKSYGIDKEKVDEFLKRLKSEKPIPIWVDLMNNTHLYLLNNNYRMCIIECYIVLESYVKEIIEEFLPRKFNDNLFKKFYKEKKERLSLNDLYDQFAELCFDFSLKQTNSPLWEKFIEFKKLRNDAIHNKLILIDEKEAHECLKTTQKNH